MAQAEPETTIDLLVVRLAKKDAGCFFGRSLKRLNLCALGNGAEHYFDATPADRRIIQARQLIAYQRDPSLQLVPAHREGLSYWLAQRFLRNALPDDFNQAWDPAREKLRKLSKRMGACRIVLLMQRMNERGKYAIRLLLVADPDAHDSIATLQQVGAAMEEALLSCERIEEVEAEALPAEAVSLRDFWEWSHFDAFDDISMTDSHAGPANHAHGGAPSARDRST